MPYIGGYEGEGYTGEVQETPTVNVGRPGAKLLLSFEDPGKEPFWHDETAYLRRFSYKRGRSSELDDFQAGTATIVLDNQDGRYNPFNTNSPYYGDLVPNRMVRITTDVGIDPVPFMMKSSAVGLDDSLRATSEDVSLFTGYIASFPMTWDISDAVAEVTIQATDAFALFEGQNTPTYRDPITNAEMNYGLIGSTGENIVGLLGAAGWGGIASDAGAPLDTDWAKIDGGYYDIAGSEATGSILSVLQGVARTEGGSFFIDGYGRAVFHDAAHDYPEGPVWGDVTGELRYSDIVAGSADAWLANEVELTGEYQGGSDTFTVSNSASIARYGKFTRGWSIYWVGSARSQMSARAQELLARYSEPRERIVSFSPQPRDDISVWRTVLTRELGDQVTIRRRPRDGTLIERTAQISGISVDAASKYEWKVVWDVTEQGHVGPNWLSAQQSSFEEFGVDPGWTCATNATIEIRSGSYVATPGQARASVPVLSGANSLFVQSSDLFAAWLRISTTIPATPGVIFTGTIPLYKNTATTARFTPTGITPYLEWYNASGSLISTWNGTAVVSYVGSSWLYPIVSGLAPAGTASVRVGIRWQSQGSPVSFYVDAAELRSSE